MLLHILKRGDDQIVLDDADSEASDGSSDQDDEISHTRSLFQKLKSLFHRERPEDVVEDAEIAAGIDDPQTLERRPISLHRHIDRAIVHSRIQKTRPTTPLVVGVEQVSLFITNDGTLITFFQAHPGNIWS
jgi:hypothetical protein